jgi:hypothetical protein
MRDIAYILLRHVGLLQKTRRVRLIHRSRVHMPPHFFFFQCPTGHLAGPEHILGVIFGFTFMHSS